MPFTISHVAAVLPFSRPLSRHRMLSAAVIGSMVPDFGFLMPWRPPRVDTHSALALLTFCLPVGLATFWLFQAVIKPSLVEVLPDGAHSRWRAFIASASPASLHRWLAAAIAILGGAITHLVWDAFTHEGARGVRMIPALDDPALDFAGHHLVGTRLLQDVSSLLGLAIVAAVVAYGLRPGPREPVSRALRVHERVFWAAGYVLMAVLLAGVFLIIRRPGDGAGLSLTFRLGNLAIALLRGFTAALVVVSLALRLRLRANP